MAASTRGISKVVNPHAQRGALQQQRLTQTARAEMLYQEVRPGRTMYEAVQSIIDRWEEKRRVGLKPVLEGEEEIKAIAREVQYHMQIAKKELSGTAERTGQSTGLFEGRRPAIPHRLSLQQLGTGSGSKGVTKRGSEEQMSSPRVKRVQSLGVLGSKSNELDVEMDNLQLRTPASSTTSNLASPLKRPRPAGRAVSWADDAPSRSPDSSVTTGLLDSPFSPTKSVRPLLPRRPSASHIYGSPAYYSPVAPSPSPLSRQPSMAAISENPREGRERDLKELQRRRDTLQLEHITLSFQPNQLERLTQEQWTVRAAGLLFQLHHDKRSYTSTSKVYHRTERLLLETYRFWCAARGGEADEGDLWPRFAPKLWSVVQDWHEADVNAEVTDVVVCVIHLVLCCMTYTAAALSQPQNRELHRQAVALEDRWRSRLPFLLPKAAPPVSTACREFAKLQLPFTTDEAAVVSVGLGGRADPSDPGVYIDWPPVPELHGYLVHAICLGLYVMEETVLSVEGAWSRLKIRL